MSIRVSQKSSLFQESVIREMTRLFLGRGDKPGVNLAQGFPDFPAPEAMKEAACRAIRADINQYAVTWGRNRSAARLRIRPNAFTASDRTRNAKSQSLAGRPKR